MATDCLILGFYEVDFQKQEKMVRSMGTETGAYRDLRLAFVRHEGRVHRGLDLFYDQYFQDSPLLPRPQRRWNYADYLWLVVTYLATYLDRRGYSYDYVDLPHFAWDELREKLEREDILTIAITTTLYVTPQPIVDLVSFIRRHNKSAKILIGGPYISSQATGVEASSLEDQLRYLGGDVYIVESEGELALTRVIDAFKGEGNLDAIPNIAYRNGKRFVRTAVEKESNTLEENMVDWSLFTAEQLGEYATVRSAKSCPFACAFCGFPARAGAYRYLPMELVERELDALQEKGITTLSIIDDTFNVPKTRFKELMRMMIRNKYDFKWNCYYRSDHGDEEAIELMGEAGCEGVLLGIESGSDFMLKNMNKTARRKHYVKAIPLLQAAGVSCYASLIVGFPGETYDTFQESLELIEETRPDFYRTQLWYCDPVTPIYQQKERFGIRGSGFLWSHDTMDVDTACDLIDRAFLSVENSVWMPQYGFEQWSTFYMQRKGMTMDQVKRYIRSFNAIVKDQLIHPGRHEARPELLAALGASARFDRPQEPDMAPVEALGAGPYLAAERFWAGEFRDQSVEPGGELTSWEDEPDGQWATAPVSLDSEALSRAAERLGAEVSELLLAAYSTLLQRISDEAATVVAALGEAPVLPLRLSAAWQSGLGELVAQTREKLAAGRLHAPWAFHVLTRPRLLKCLGTPRPRFDFGYQFAAGPAADESGLRHGLGHYPELYTGLRVILDVGGESELQASLSSRFDAERTGELAAYVSEVLRRLAADPGAVLEDVAPRLTAMNFTTLGDQHAQEMFQF